MMEPTHRSRFIGRGFKPPKGAIAVVLSVWEKIPPRVGSGMDRGDELTVTAEEVSRKCHILSKAVKVSIR
ncbi:hypothetical protein [Cyclobacterium xiamenense]|nr:hypothetical protein [Cyclobacterium xiamenense]